MESQKNYEDLFFTDNFLFCKIMSESESICKRVITTLLGIEVEKLTYLNKQEDNRPTYSAHGIRLDVMAKSTGKTFDLEMQTVVKENLPKRARYYQATMDVDSLKKKQPYSELPDSFIVFICMEDPFNGKLPRYTVKPVCIEYLSMKEKSQAQYYEQNFLHCPYEIGDDKTTKIYYNAMEWGKFADKDSEVRAFLKFLATKKPENPLAEDIMTEVEIARHNEPWRVEFMQERERRQEAYNEGIADGRAEQLAADQAEIAELKARLAKYEPVES